VKIHYEHVISCFHKASQTVSHVVGQLIMSNKSIQIGSNTSLMGILVLFIWLIQLVIGYSSAGQRKSSQNCKV